MRGASMEFVWSEMRVSVVPKYWYWRKTTTNTKIPARQYLRFDYPQTLGNDGDCLYPPKKQHIWSICVLLSEGEIVEQFYSILKELAENCDFENREEAIIRDIFITNMLDDDIQR